MVKYLVENQCGLKRGIIMRKIFSFILILVLTVSLCACEKENETAGTYKTIGIFSDTKYTLKGDMSFKATDSTSGTYVLNTDGSILFEIENDFGFDFIKTDDYYYRQDIYGGFSEDTTEDMRAPVFDEDGRSNQSFYKGVGTTYYGLNLKDDGTYSASIEKYNEKDYSLISKEEFEGTYSFKNDILWLKHGKNKYPMIRDDGVLYYNVIQKVKK